VSLLGRWRNRHRHDWETLRTRWFWDKIYGDLHTKATQRCTGCRRVRTAQYSGYLTKEEIDGDG
jgi:hypothetical protein